MRAAAHTLLAATVVVALVSACVTAQAQTLATKTLTSYSTAMSGDAAAGTPLPTATGIVTRDQVALRAAPNQAAAVQTTLMRGELLELRGERGDYLQVWDHHRERGGWVARSLVWRIDGASPNSLQAVLGFVSEQRDSESLGIALAAAAIHATPAAELAGSSGAMLLDAIGRQAERLAERANSARSAESTALSAHLDIAARHGVRFASREVGAGAETRTRLCYEGDSWRRLLALPSASAEQRARAMLALTRDDCDDPAAHPRQREQLAAERERLLQRLGRAERAALAPHERHRLALRQAALLSTLAFHQARRGDASAARAAATNAIGELATVPRGELIDEDLQRHTEAALRINAVRWAAAEAQPGTSSSFLEVRTAPAADGQTCVTLHDTRWKDGQPLAQRCTWGLVWPASARANRDHGALALAVQPADGWRELWLFRREGRSWSVQVLPPAAAAPGLGYAEFAGWVPGSGQLLVAREAVAEGRTLRRFEVLRLDTLTAERQHTDASQLGAFNRWGDVAWRRESLALR